MHKRRVLEICLDEIEAGATGARGKGRAAHVLAARLIWPRPAIAEKVSLKTVDLQGGKADLNAAIWGRRILFKETVQGPCGLSIEVTRRVSDTQAARFIHFLYASVFTALSAEVAATAPGGGWVGLLRQPLRFLARETGTPPKAWPAVMAAGMLDVRPESIGKRGERVQIEIPLRAPKDVFETHRRQRGGETAMRRERVRKAGEANGRAVISIAAYD